MLRNHTIKMEGSRPLCRPRDAVRVCLDSGASHGARLGFVWLHESTSPLGDSGMVIASGVDSKTCPFRGACCAIDLLVLEESLT